MEVSMARLTLREIEQYNNYLLTASTIEDNKVMQKLDKYKVFKNNTDFMLKIDEVGVSGRTLWACPGSNKFVEWVSNLRFLGRNGFHRGFYRAGSGFADQLLNTPVETEIDRLADNEVVTHSRGIYGLIMALILVEQGIWDAGATRVISFGAPEPCKRDGIKRLEKAGIEHHRIVTERDFVQHLGMSDHYETHLYVLPTVRSFDHTNYAEAIKLAKVRGMEV
jgi:hypothetical protein